MANPTICKLFQDALDKKKEMCPYEDYQKECDSCPRYDICYPREAVADGYGSTFSPSVIITTKKILNLNSRYRNSACLRINSIKWLETKRLRTIKEQLKDVTGISVHKRLGKCHALITGSKPFEYGGAGQISKSKPFEKGAKPNGFNPEVGGRR